MGIKLRMHITVSSGIDLLKVNTIQNTKETITTRTQQMIQFLTKSRRQNFLRIAFTYSRNCIGKQNTTPHNVNHIRQFSNLRVEETISSNASHFKNTIAKDALIGKIMYSIDGCRMSEYRIIAIDRVQPVWHNAGMPI